MKTNLPHSYSHTTTSSLSKFASVFHYGREKITIPSWMQAWRIAESPVMPRTYPLMEIYDMVLIDAEVITAINNRKNKVLGEPFLVLDGQGGYDEKASKLLKGSWFDDFVNLVLDTEFFGYSLIELGSNLNEDYSLKEVNLVERRNIIPAKKLVLPYPFSSYQEGIDFTGEHYRRWYIFTRSKRFPLGLLLYASPYAVLSRDSLIRHADFNRDYGKPYKVVYTDKEGEERQDVLDSLLNVEEELNGVFDTDERIEISFPSGASGTVDTYDRMNEKTSKKLLKIIQGHIKLSNDTEGGGLQTYQNKDSIAKTPSEEIKEYDMARVEGVVGEELFPRLLDFNYPFDTGYSFIYLDTYLRDLQRQKKQISEKALELALTHFEVEAGEFEDLTGIKVKKKVMLQGSLTEAVPSTPNENQKQNKREKTTTDSNLDDTETGNQVDTQNSQVIDSMRATTITTASVDDTQNRDFFEYGAVTLPIQNKKLWVSMLPPIDPNDLYINPGESMYGYEDSPHLTVLYGLHPDKVKTLEIEDFLQKQAYESYQEVKGIQVWLTGISAFEADKGKAYEVLKFDVLSPGLVQLNARMKKRFDYTNNYPKYSPHATIAFLKKGTAKKYTTSFDSPDFVKLHLTEAQYSDGRGNKTLIKFDNNSNGNKL